MKIIELLREEGTVGAVGSTTGIAQPVGAVSQTSAPGGTTQNNKKPDPNQQQLAKILTQQGKTKPEDLTAASTALQKTMQNPNNPNLTDQEKKLLGSLMGSTLQNPATVTAIKAVAQQKPVPIGQPMGQQSGQPVGQQPATAPKI